MKFHIVITDNETNKVLKDINADALIAAIHTEEFTDVLEAVRCNGLAFAETVASLMDLLEHIKKKHPKVYKLAKKYRKIKELKENNENE